MTDKTLQNALDALYAAGPGAAATARAQAKLRQALARTTPPTVYYAYLRQTPVGPIGVALNAKGVVAVQFEATEAACITALQKKLKTTPVRSPDRTSEATRQLREYLSGERLAFDLPVDLSGTSDFQRRVLRAAQKVPRGQVVTYTELAKRIRQPKAARAVGQALRRNPAPIIIPCHRVLAADGSLRGYLGQHGIQTKARLLELEGARL